MSNTVAIIIISVVALTVIILLIWKNKKDKKLLYPDSQDSVEKTMMDQERRRDKI